MVRGPIARTGNYFRANVVSSKSLFYFDMAKIKVKIAWYRFYYLTNLKNVVKFGVKNWLPLIGISGLGFYFWSLRPKVCAPGLSHDLKHFSSFYDRKVKKVAKD